MKILALDSAAKAAAVALLDGKKLIAKSFNDDGNTHSCSLLPMIENLLLENSLSINDIDMFAASSGPGSFTGVRIGAATLKGLAFGKDRPCVPVSALHALGYNMRSGDGYVCALMDARRGQFYTALFKVENGSVKRITEDAAKSGEEIAKELATYESVTLVGDGAKVALPFFEGLSVTLAPEEKLLCDGESVGLLAICEFENGTRTTDAQFAPTYLRLPQAERERLEKEKSSSLSS
ncbi:MAG: tRNA (adenosine(37)-N6)-threonylcarbamoyltransferase complex dimerization subunit type 1 TsaB [Clostridia bacterium]|nr:tRNA (adenosine(37)-N6)-threonylcarbamoyltransferase complex dimerization subunit type 1 TsaB [Clostridia bacterium]